MLNALNSVADDDKLGLKVMLFSSSMNLQLRFMQFKLPPMEKESKRYLL